MDKNINRTRTRNINNKIHRNKKRFEERFKDFCLVTRKNFSILPERSYTFFSFLPTLYHRNIRPFNNVSLVAGMRPKMKNHYRAHQLSVWLRLVPELHRAGMEDVDSRHNLFRGHSDPNLYDGSVRPDPLSRISEEFKRKNVTTEPPTTTDYNAATCVSYIQTTNLQNINNTGIDTLANLDAAGYVIKILNST